MAKRKALLSCILLVSSLILAFSIAKADDYPEVPSTVAYNPGYLTAWGDVFGSILPAGDADPGCNEINAICRRVCADLPPGRTLGSISDVGIIPPGYAREVGNPEVYHNQVWRVCRRVKNWGTGTRKTFAFKVVYAPDKDLTQNCVVGLGPTLAQSAAKSTRASGDLLCSQFSQTLFGEGSLNISDPEAPPNTKITVVRTDAVSKSQAVEPGNSYGIDANGELPNGARKMGTRYQVAVPGSGWVECDLNSGQCPISTANWVKRSDGAGTLRNDGKEPLMGRVVLQFAEANAFDLGDRYLVK